jgi:hypothetical protein
VGAYYIVAERHPKCHDNLEVEEDHET